MRSCARVPRLPELSSVASVSRYNDAGRWPASAMLAAALLPRSPGGSARPRPLEPPSTVSDPLRKELGQIRRAATTVELRLRAARGVRALPVALTPALALGAVTLAVRKALPELLSNRHAWEILLGVAALVVVAVAVAVLRRLPPRAGTVTLDRHHRPAGRAVRFREPQEALPGRRQPLQVLRADLRWHPARVCGGALRVLPACGE